MNLDFLDSGIPTERVNEELATNEIIKFRNYCKSLKKTASQLTQKELDEYYNKKDKED